MYKSRCEYSIEVNTKKDTDFLYVKSGSSCTAKILVFDSNK